MQLSHSYPSYFLSLRTSHPRECASEWTTADCYCYVKLQMTQSLLSLRHSHPHPVLTFGIVADCANKINH